MIIIGIDPGTSTGFAAMDTAIKTKDKLITVKTLTSDKNGLAFWKCIDAVAVVKMSAKGSGDKIVVYIENPNQNVTYVKAGDGTSGKREKISRNVGMNQKEAQLLIEGVERLGVDVKTLVPNSQKWSADLFKRYTGYSKQTSQHARDAVRLIWGR